VLGHVQTSDILFDGGRSQVLEIRGPFGKKNNNNPICKAPECQKTSVALKDSGKISRLTAVIKTKTKSTKNTYNKRSFKCRFEGFNNYRCDFFCLEMVYSATFWLMF